jgi:hypothetical protein
MGFLPISANKPASAGEAKRAAEENGARVKTGLVDLDAG